MISVNPLAATTQYTLVTVPAGNGLFVTNGVRSGDTFFSGYTTDGWGNLTETAYKVDHVVNEDTLVLVTGPPAPVTMASRAEIWRTLAKINYSTAIGTVAGAFANRRVEGGLGQNDLESWSAHRVRPWLQQEVCLALAGERAAGPPHQGLTNVAIQGFALAAQATPFFNQTQLDNMAGFGVWIVTKDDGGQHHHALGTR